eukprot:scaffold184755_cov17-Tisochrysis_lutea.AAC.1
MVSGSAAMLQVACNKRQANFDTPNTWPSFNCTVLDASHCCSLGDNALEGLAQGGTPFLKCLMLERCAITNAGLGVCGQ